MFGWVKEIFRRKEPVLVVEYRIKMPVPVLMVGDEVIVSEYGFIVLN